MPTTPTTDIIVAASREHAPSDRVCADVSRVMASDAINYPAGEYSAETHEITDATALTIASWFAAPSGPAAAFATLATTGRVSAEALSDAISAEFRSGWVGPRGRSCVSRDMGDQPPVADGRHGRGSWRALGVPAHRRDALRLPGMRRHR